ncbi:uncharacterized protein LOC118736225 [Rhagoletis pomonella]|uniref:uncharacterized protein LOC118736225 n=1 Tax=Rhagoletis pomonella TaxID=28610 RepID=UPI00177ABAC3|nr:uncharacterized protein LOC118736225 [Rhagoletis pomonella]
MSSTESMMLNVYWLTPIIISMEIEDIENQSVNQQLNRMSFSHHANLPQVHSDTNDEATRYSFTTNMLRTIDVCVPDLSNIVSVDHQETKVRLGEITRKTAPPNIEWERRMEELAAFNQTKAFLRSHKNIVITDADKGNKTVAMYESEYIEKINKLLEDKNTYKTSRTDPTSTLQRKNNKIVDELYKAKHINKREKQLLTSTAAAAPRLYGLPKIHKPQVHLRPIASSVKVPCYKLSKYVGEILKPLISERYNVKNAFNLKERLTNISVCDEDVLVSFDVISLFTNIPTMLATKIIMIKWDQIQRTTSIPKHKFQQILDFCLKDNNYFMCNNKLYTQTFGMPMGNPLSPTIADIIMDDLLDNTISELKQHFNIDIKFINKYVDDIFAITNRNDVNTILETLNKYHPKLQFTMEMEENASIPFLDVRIHKNNNNIVLNWYSKPTSSGRLINYLSSQPRKYKINTAKNLIHKILTISDQKFHEANIEKIHSILKSNNYPNHLIRELIKQETMRIGNQQNKTPTTATANTPKKYYSVTYIPKLSENFDRSTLKEQNITLAYKTNNTLARIYTRTKKPTRQTATKQRCL